MLTYSNNQARINEKKGADAGIDGIAYFLIDKDPNGKAIFQVKSGGSNRSTVATLNSDRQREKAEFGFLITMDPPTKAMRDEIAAAASTTTRCSTVRTTASRSSPSTKSCAAIDSTCRWHDRTQ